MASRRLKESTNKVFSPNIDFPLSVELGRVFYAQSPGPAEVANGDLISRTMIGDQKTLN